MEKKEKKTGLLLYVLIGIGVGGIFLFLAYILPIIYQWLFGYFAFSEFLKFIVQMKHGKKKPTNLFEKVALFKKENQPKG